MERLAAVRRVVERVVAARCGGHPDPPLRDMRKFDIFTCRSNIDRRDVYKRRIVMEMKKILWPTDFSSISQQALRM